MVPGALFRDGVALEPKRPAEAIRPFGTLPALQVRSALFPGSLALIALLMLMNRWTKIES
ncbi:hypothetical protein NS365_05235 [Aureimonas ureilytica]|uniref:Uncharacterized protein n=1 Tax=Aureimonas ureilytica TaxID=401562 RepID=A0A175RW02_9HYPH|nr:hypothetical protein NS365_05235 [Aureimonas ureilytica]